MTLTTLLLAALLAAGPEAGTSGLPEILRLLDSGQAARAEALLRDRMAEERAAPAVHYLLGVSLLYQRRFGEAAAELEVAVAARADRAQWFHTLALCQSELGQCGAAVRSLDRALALADLPIYRFDRATCQIAVGRFAAAEEDLRAVLRAAPRHLAALLALAGLLHDQGRGEEARGMLEAALAWAPGSAELPFRLGHVALASGNAERAAEHFRAALERLPAHLGATYGLARALAALGRRDEAEGAEARFRELSRREEAIENRRQYLALAPTDLAVMLELAGWLLDLGRAEEAWKLLDGASRMVPPTPELTRLLERAAAEAGRTSVPVTP